ncbi:hypothetical protein CPAR01_05130 [Colletotrichum paranaense]|uniref:Uncharacterized protein n=6 Tax=Colletotrichum acutatum species complex TaxID=2707335 RepID=A0A9P9XEB6_9PEZI|nr:uncharacterized protein CLUP02_12412 [Colletotrichum lupini]XP_060305491.1 uncharacterized protein CCOS01_15972 [Colletotrichum costaricense]XP_060350875.1 uncharacterized protein CPAR01_05130 [Colletotrichum paranaense]XP_060382542.1 uncharacterized protein CTAM01_06670 [Colletotrichum tamarilloi]XP_060393369.1 uncharacterized protein CABS01_14322 [Colletotrichum abscissum]KAI3548591.1 hypothetical protein CSPX01_03020 [Colletotrichum filicis]KAK1448456.1 hypothetical protein CCUS01_11678
MARFVESASRHPAGLKGRRRRSKRSRATRMEWAEQRVVAAARHVRRGQEQPSTAHEQRMNTTFAGDDDNDDFAACRHTE